jgi:hypothetical protein
MNTKDSELICNRAILTYLDNLSLRALIQMIPHIGGSIDILLAGKGAKIQQARLESFLDSLSARVKEIEDSANTTFQISQDEELYDFILATFSDVVKTKEKIKRDRFSALLASQIMRPRDWSDAGCAERILAALDDIHIKVLLEAASAPEGVGVWKGVCPISLFEADDSPMRDTSYLQHWLPEYPLSMLRLACAELLAKGLLQDEGVGRLSIRAMTYFVITDLGLWFIDWLS